MEKMGFSITHVYGLTEVYGPATVCAKQEAWSQLSPRDRAAAHKLLAFIFCTSNRMSDCEVQFRAARAADPGFALSKSEAGHPLWGPVYQRVQQR